MTKKRMAMIAVLPLTAAVIFGALAMLPPRPGVTKANFDRIQEGMTKAEVEQIFGREPDIQKGTLRWRADDGPSLAVIGVWDDSVWGKHWDDREEPFLDKIRRWIHLPKG